MTIEQLFFQLINVSLGTRICLAHSPTADEWRELYSMAKMQSLVGVCFAGVHRLVNHLQEPPKMLYLNWMGMAAKIQQRNEVVSCQCVDIQRMLNNEGFDSLILKGQGVAMLYPEHLQGLRQSGDIDIWAMPKEATKDGRIVMTAKERRGMICDYCAKIDPHYDRKKEGYLHTDVRVFPNTDVEWHFTPSFLSKPSANKKLQEWFEEQWIDSFIIKDESSEIKAPGVEFNLVFLLLHIYRHILFEGIGMRQVLDYYFVLIHSTAVDRIKAMTVLKSLGVDAFAEALMWVFTHVLAKENESWLLCKPDEARGRMLLEMILEGGNFGRSGEYAITGGDHSAWWHVRRYVGRNSKLLRYYPSEIIWNLLNKMKI